MGYVKKIILGSLQELLITLCHRSIYKHQTQNVYELIRPANTSGKKSEGFLFSDKLSKTLEKTKKSQRIGGWFPTCIVSGA